MPTEWLDALPKLVSIIEKGGVIGVLVIVVVALSWNTRRIMRELNRVYRQRDYCRQVRLMYKLALDGAGIKVDIADIEREMKEEEKDYL